MFCVHYIATLFLLIIFPCVISTVDNQKWIFLSKNNKKSHEDLVDNSWKPLYGKTINKITYHNVQSKNLSNTEIVNKPTEFNKHTMEEAANKPNTIVISENFKKPNNSHNSTVDKSFPLFLNYFLYNANQTENLKTTVAESRSKKSKGKGKFKVKKKYKKFLLPLLIAYKLKFFTLIPVFIGGLVLLAGSTGLAGFFFALFATIMGLKNSKH